MKIGIDISQIVYGTGVSKYTEYLVENLLKIDKRNQYILFGSSLRQTEKLIRFKEKFLENKNVQFKIVKLPPKILEFIWN